MYADNLAFAAEEKQNVLTVGRALKYFYLALLYQKHICRGIAGLKHVFVSRDVPASSELDEIGRIFVR